MKTDIETTTPATPSSRPALTTANINHWFQTTLADPKRREGLKHDWVSLLLAEIAATPEQQESLRSLPPSDAKELQAAIAHVVEHGGTIHLDRPSEASPGTLFVRPTDAGGVPAHGGVPAAESDLAVGGAAGFSVGIFHCTFDGFFRHWHCGWGPAKHK